MGVDLLRCISSLMALSGHRNLAARCPLLGVKPTSHFKGLMSANDPKRTSTNDDANSNDARRCGWPSGRRNAQTNLVYEASLLPWSSNSNRPSRTNRQSLAELSIPSACNAISESLLGSRSPVRATSITLFAMISRTTAGCPLSCN